MWYDPKTREQREIRYATNQNSPFKDEQKGERDQVRNNLLHPARPGHEADCAREKQEAKHFCSQPPCFPFSVWFVHPRKCSLDHFVARLADVLEALDQIPEEDWHAQRNDDGGSEDERRARFVRRRVAVYAVVDFQPTSSLAQAPAAKVLQERSRDGRKE